MRTKGIADLRGVRTTYCISHALFQLLTGLMKYRTIRGAVIKGDEFLNSGEFCKNGKKLADLSHI